MDYLYSKPAFILASESAERKFKIIMASVLLIILSSALLEYTVLLPFRIWIIANIVCLLYIANGFVGELVKSIDILVFLGVQAVCYLINWIIYGGSGFILEFFLFNSCFIFFSLVPPNLVRQTRLSFSISFYRGLRVLTLAIFLFAVAQTLWQLLGFGIISEEYSRGRILAPGFRQVTSFFDEPAFLSQFCAALLFIYIFVLKQSKWLSVFPLLTVALSASLGGLVACTVLYLLKIRLRYFILVLPISIFLAYSGSGFFLFQYIVNRLRNEIVANVEFIGEVPGVVRGSGGIRVIDELNWGWHVLKNSAVLGFGAADPIQQYTRVMSLNAVTEALVRWGVLGLLLFLLILYFRWFRIIRSSSMKFRFFVFLLLYFFIDGAIAKPGFWMPVSLVLCSVILKERSYPRSTQNRW